MLPPTACHHNTAAGAYSSTNSLPCQTSVAVASIRALMAAAHQRALERGLAHVELDVRSHNRSARAFYEALGYETVQQRLRSPRWPPRLPAR
jgi:GNAT superfamily N-acetyltransferase